MKGILFRPEMIKANQCGTKTVTRQTSGLKEINLKPDAWKLDAVIENGVACFLPQGCNDPVYVKFIKPRYQVNDIVYIREAYMVNKEYDHLKPSEIPEIGRKVAIWYYADGNHYADKVNEGAGKVRSPLFMPAWAARDFIQITSVRAERLQEITAEDTVKEGVRGMSYQPLWDSINKEHQWASNPFVWVYSFKRVDKPVSPLV